MIRCIFLSIPDRNDDLHCGIFVQRLEISNCDTIDKYGLEPSPAYHRDIKLGFYEHITIWYTSAFRPRYKNNYTYL